MVTHQVIDLLAAKVNAIAHQANCFHIMGGGVARVIRQKYPEAYNADLKTRKGSRKKLGTFSKADASDGMQIYNVYSQFDLSRGIGDRATLYDMVEQGLRAVEEDLAGPMTITDTIDLNTEPVILGIPYNYGCVLGGGSWRIVEAIIHEVFSTSPIDVLLCEWPAPTKPTSFVDSVIAGVNSSSSLDDLKRAIDRARGGPTPPLQQVGFA